MSSATPHTSISSRSSPTPKHNPHTRYSASFFNTDPETAKHRNAYVKTLGLGTFLITVVIFAILSIYWGSLWKANDEVHNINGWIVDFDKGAIGQAVTRTLLGVTGPKTQISWKTVNASQFVNGPSDLVDAVVDEKCWVAVSINPGATATLDAAIVNANGSYNGSLAVTAYVAEARNENSYPAFVLPNIITPLDMAVQTFGLQNAKQLATISSANLQAILSTAPSVVSQPMFYTIANTRPFDVPVAAAVDFVGLIYLLIIAFIVSMLNYNARHVRSQLAMRLRMSSLIRMRLVAPIAIYFILSWFYALLSLAFHVPFNRRFGHSGFVIYWAMTWIAMTALGLTMEAMITLLTPMFVPFFLVLWIIVNVSVAFYPIELLPAIFRYGYATPFYNVSRTVRTIVFGTRNQVGLNFGVQFAWIAVSLITIPLFQYVLRRREERAWYKQQNQEKA